MTTVTRRIVRSTSPNPSATYSESGNNNQFQSNYDDRDKKSDERDDNDDDKETRLTLMEEVLLLGLKDREVC